MNREEIKTCENCRWVGCRNYGHCLPACTKHILESKETLLVATEVEG